MSRTNASGVHSLHSFGYTDDTKLVLDLPNRRLIPEFAAAESSSEFFKEPAKLRLKAFCLVCYLALRRTDGSDGWVDLQEVVERVPRWRGLSASDAGKHIELFRGRYKWFGKVEWHEITRGPYRLGPEVELIPDRDAVNLFLASMSDQQREPRELTDTELEAYHLLAQSGVYAAPVVDLIQQRLGNAAQLPEPHERLTAYRILVTLAKNRGQTGQARTLANQALPLARQLGRSDDIAYLLDQLGCIAEIEGVPKEAMRCFAEEINFLTNSENPRSTFHLVGAYRGLAIALRSLGKIPAARSAIRRSRASCRLRQGFSKLAWPRGHLLQVGEGQHIAQVAQAFAGEGIGLEVLGGDQRLHLGVDDEGAAIGGDIEGGQDSAQFALRALVATGGFSAGTGAGLIQKPADCAQQPPHRRQPTSTSIGQSGNNLVNLGDVFVCVPEGALLAAGLGVEALAFGHMRKSANG